jgi:ATP-dependent Clp endopeptidase proteolytic subunit ClpP
MNIIKDISGRLSEVELRHEPVVIRVNKFDEESAKKFEHAMSVAQSTGQPLIPVVIDSYGGQVYSLMSMIANIKSSKIPVATIVEGKAMSCGALLFSFGSPGYRYMDKHATIMIHDVSSGAHGKIEEIKADAKEGDRLNQLLYRQMAANCGKEPEFFLKQIHDRSHADWYLDAEEAQGIGLANHLRVPELKVKVDVLYSFE